MIDLMDVLYLILCILAGCFIAVQAAVNGTLGKLSGVPSFSVLMNFVIGLLPVFIYYLIESKAFTTGNYGGLPVWTFGGGLLGAFYILAVVVSVPHLGTATVLSVTIAGQVILSLILDHFGVLGLETRKLTVGRVIGAVLSVGGAVLITIF